MTQNVETRIDPMTAVAQGASIYASTLPVRRDLYPGETGDELNLDVEFEGTCIEDETYVTVKAAKPQENLEVCLIRRSDGWNSGYSPAGGKGGLIIAELLPNMPNVFRVSAKIDGTEVPCFPSEITIVQGTKTGSAVLPYNIGIEVFNPNQNKRVFTTLTGLEKNRPLPGRGTVYGLKTLNDLRGGVEKDTLRRAVYQGDDSAEGKTAALYEYVSDVLITGDDIASYIPKDSYLNVTINVDRSEMMSVVCEFPQTGQKVEKPLDTSKRQADRSVEYLRDLLENASTQVRNLRDELGESDISSGLSLQIEQVEEEMNAGGQAKQIEQHLKEILRKVEEYANCSKWDLCLDRLRSALFSLRIQAAKKSGDERVARMVDSFELQVERMADLKDEMKARYLRRQIEEYEYAICRDEIYRDYIRYAEREFSEIKWADVVMAQQLVIEGTMLLKNNPNATYEQTKDIVDTLYVLKECYDDVEPGGSDFSSGKTKRSRKVPRIDIPSM